MSEEENQVQEEQSQDGSNTQKPTIIITFDENWEVSVRFAEPKQVNVNHILVAAKQLSVMGEFMLQSQMAMEQQRLIEQQRRQAQEQAQNEALLRRVAQDIQRGR